MVVADVLDDAGEGLVWAGIGGGAAVESLCIASYLHASRYSLELLGANR
jgi:hypothetical protein